MQNLIEIHSSFSNKRPLFFNKGISYKFVYFPDICYSHVFWHLIWKTIEMKSFHKPINHNHRHNHRHNHNFFEISY